MAVSFTNQLNRLLANNKPDRALEEIFEAFRLFKKKYPDRANEIDDLESQLIMLSARMKELQTKEQSIQLSSNEIEVARARMFSSLIGIIKGFQDFPAFSEFLNSESVESSTEEPARKVKEVPAAPTAPPYAHTQVHQSAPTSSRQGLVIGIVGGGLAVVALILWLVLGRNQSQPDTAKPQPQAVDADPARDQQLWETAKKSNTPEAYDMYIKAYENGLFTDSAQIKINEAIAQKEEKLWADAKAAGTRQAYMSYLKNSSSHKYGPQADEEINKLLEKEKGSAKLKELIGISSRDTLVINDKIAKLSQGLADLKTEADKVEVQKIIAELNATLQEGAHIKSPQDFVVARSVSESRNTVGVDSVFNQRTVWAWAKTSSSRSETVRFAWYNSKGEQLNMRTYSVQGVDGYRVFTQQSFPAPGRYEVRLYNSNNILIGRRVFVVKG
ncbi:MAG: hypothetical protein R3C61_20640 [Bacteroidia bacterium]